MVTGTLSLSSTAALTVNGGAVAQTLDTFCRDAGDDQSQRRPHQCEHRKSRLIRHATFAQSGGTHAISQAFFIGNYAGGSGTYNLSGGLLTADYENVGGSGSGSFTQSGGTHAVSNLGVGELRDSSEIYGLTAAACSPRPMSLLA